MSITSSSVFSSKKSIQEIKSLAETPLGILGYQIPRHEVPQRALLGKIFNSKRRNFIDEAVKFKKSIPPPNVYQVDHAKTGKEWEKRFYSPKCPRNTTIIRQRYVPGPGQYHTKYVHEPRAKGCFNQTEERSPRFLQEAVIQGQSSPEHQLDLDKRQFGNDKLSPRAKGIGFSKLTGYRSNSLKKEVTKKNYDPLDAFKRTQLNSRKFAFSKKALSSASMDVAKRKKYVPSPNQYKCEDKDKLLHIPCRATRMRR